MKTHEFKAVWYEGFTNVGRKGGHPILYDTKKIVTSFSPGEDTEKERTSTTLYEYTRCGVRNTVHRPNVYSFQEQMERSFRLYYMLRQRTNPSKLWAVIRSKLCDHKKIS